MTTSTLPSLPRSSASVWLQALRLYATSASVIPVLLGISLAARTRTSSGLAFGGLALIGAVLIHLATNLLNDVGDFRSGVDRAGVSEGSGVLTQGLLRDASVARVAYALFGLGALAGLPVALARGLPLWLVGALGLVGGWAYTAGPRYKYYALGDVCVFALMGPLMTVGAYLAVAGRVELRAALASVPLGLLVVAILHANNLRDLDADRAAGIRTVARGLGERGSRIYLGVLIFGAYASLVAEVAAGVLPWPALAAALTLPLALKLVSSIVTAKDPHALRSLQPVEQTAKLHMLFGLLLVAGTTAVAAFH